MKTILKNKKYLPISIFSITLILIFILFIPQVLALSDSSKNTLNNQDANVIANKNNVSEENTTSEMYSPPYSNVSQSHTNNPSIDTENIVDHTAEISQPITNTDVIAIKDNALIFENTTFNYVDTSDDVNGLESVKRYKSADGAEIYIDSKTNKAVRISFIACETPDTLPKANNANEVESVATKFFAKLCDDPASYNETKIYNNPNQNTYTVYFYKTINGYSTTVKSLIRFDENLRINYYYCAPDIFKNIDLSNLVIDEKAILEQINNQCIEKRGESFNGISITNMELTVKNSKVIMLVNFTELDKDGKPIVTTNIFQTEIEIK